MKVCITCSKPKIITDFQLRKDTNKYRNECIECQKNRHSKYRQIAKSSKKEILEQRICSKCKIFKSIDCFYKNNLDKYGYRTSCKQCDDAEKEFYISQNKEIVVQRRKKYYNDNKISIQENSKKYYEHNTEKIKKRNRKYYKNRRNADIMFKLKTNISRQIHHSLNQRKSKRSIFKYLDYSLEELRKHLENLFEYWMTWDNYGRYNKSKWNDNDPSTWTWQIDHKIPHSTFKYKSMESEEFKQCWALENLRPYSAKQNIIDGSRRVI